MNPQVCGQCGQQSGANAAACAACWAARNPQPPNQPQNVPPPAVHGYSQPPPANPPQSPPPKPDSDGWNPHSGNLPANSAFRVLKIIASVIGIAGVLVALFLIAYNALR